MSAAFDRSAWRDRDRASHLFKELRRDVQRPLRAAWRLLRVGVPILGEGSVRSFGWRVMHVAVGLLAIDYIVFFSVFTADRYLLEVPLQLIQFNSIVDLVLEMSARLRHGNNPSRKGGVRCK